MNKQRKMNPDAVYFSSDSYQLAESIVNEDGEKKVQLKDEIPIFREGQFEHPVYGELDFTPEYLNQIVANFNNRVVPQEISFDQDHMPWLGALAWVKNENGSLFVRNESVQLSNNRTEQKAVLYAKVEYTDLGIEKVGGKIFRYFSSEIHPDYSTREVIEMGDEKGGKAVRRYGPTLIGGGFTNRPFIPALGGAYNEDGEEQDVEVYSSNDGGAMFFAVAPKQEEKQTVADDSEERDEQKPSESTEEEVEFNEEEPTQGDKMKFSELMQKVKTFASPEEQIEYIEQNLTEVDDDSQDAAQAVLEAKKEKYNAQKAVEDAAARYSRIKEERDNLQKEKRDLEFAVVEAKQQKFESQVKEFAATLKSEGHVDSLVETTKDLLLSLKPDSRNMKFSVIGEDEDRDLTVVDMVTEIFNAIPEDMRINLSASMENPAEGDDVTEVNPEQKFSETDEGDDSDAGDAGELSLVEKFREKNPKLSGWSDDEILKASDEDGNLDYSKLNR